MKQILNPVSNLTKNIKLLILSLVMVILASSMFAVPALATGVDQIPDITPGSTWVIDRGEVLSRSNEGKISTAFENLANKTGNEVRFVTVRRLDYGETPESFTKQLFQRWFPTKEQSANQTLLMIDTLTNGVSIVTGDKVKSLLSDDIAKSVASETLTAPLRDGNKYNQAFLDASDRIVAVLSGNPIRDHPK